MTDSDLLMVENLTYLNGAVNEAPSDVYGGVTSNIIVGSFGHWDDSYWYDKHGKPTNAQCRELWAEYFSYCMTENTASMGTLRKHFPQSSAFNDYMKKTVITVSILLFFLLLAKPVIIKTAEKVSQ